VSPQGWALAFLYSWASALQLTRQRQKNAFFRIDPLRAAIDEALGLLFIARELGEGRGEIEKALVQAKRRVSSRDERTRGYESALLARKK
jgi:hypothetical protein